ncbi:hypothetical protein BGY98DRAFT_1098870 [Russula aff. rugulosa BPL654]|nr:hypothetical protein BGY98DRAFT_1098870 [Russula aff. rugulosa BPL654]
MPMDMCSIFKPMRGVERADRQIQRAEVLLRDHQSVMRSDDRIFLEEHMLCAKEFRFGVERKSWRAKVEQAKQYSKRAQMVLDMIKDIVENIRNW